MRSAAARRLGPALALATAACGTSSVHGTPSDAGPPTEDVVIVHVDSGCGSTLADPHNCGGCGVDCEGGVCVEGVCSPLPPSVLVSGLHTPLGIVVDDTNVYWMSLGTSSPTTSQVMKCAKAGCSNAPTVLATGTWTSSTRLALYQGTLYWASPDTVMSCPIGGCPAGPTVVASGKLAPTDIAVGAGGIYVGDSIQRSLLMYPLVSPVPDGGVASTALWSSTAAPFAIAAAATNVYFGTSGVTLISCSAGGCSTVLSGSVLTALSVDGTNVYFGSQTEPSVGVATAPGTVGTCPQARCAAGLKLLTNKITDCVGIAGDGTNVYFTDPGMGTPVPPGNAQTSGLGRVLKCPIAGCTEGPTPVAGFVNFPQQIAVDDKAVYWTDFGSGGIDASGTTDGRVMTSAK